MKCALCQEQIEGKNIIPSLCCFESTMAMLKNAIPLITRREHKVALEKPMNTSKCSSNETSRLAVEVCLAWRKTNITEQRKKKTNKHTDRALSINFLPNIVDSMEHLTVCAQRTIYRWKIELKTRFSINNIWNVTYDSPAPHEQIRWSETSKWAFAFESACMYYSKRPAWSKSGSRMQFNLFSEEHPGNKQIEYNLNL